MGVPEHEARKLLATHLQDLAASGIDLATAKLAGIYSATEAQVAEIVGFKAGSGMVIPYPGTNFVRVRLDEPYKGPGWDKPAKYLTPKGAGNRLYFPPNMPESDSLLVITEGEKKALAACMRGIPCIATAGVWSWKARSLTGEKQSDEAGMLADFDKIDFTGKVVCLVYDSDIDQYHPAWTAYGRLAEQIYARGAHIVRIVTLPSVYDDPEKKTGLDDYLVKRSADDLRAILRETPVWIPSGDGVQGFANPRIDAAVERLRAEGTPDAAYDPETLHALAALMMVAETEYARAVQRMYDALPRRIDRRALSKDVRNLVQEIQKRQGRMHHAPEVETGPIEVLLPEAPIRLRQPAGWRITEHGIQYASEEGYETVCPVPVLLAGRLRNIDTGVERVQLVFMRDGGWHSVSASPSTVFASHRLVDLADRGLPVSSETAKQMVRYLSALQSENLDVIPLKRSVSRFGWIGSNAFLPGLAPDIEVDLDDAAQHVVAAYRESGDYDTWLAWYESIRQYPMVRFAVAAGFAAPLLSLVGHRTMILHLWGPSRAGKTAAGWGAISMWGDPEALMGTFNATKVGLELMAAMYSDLPLLVDERQVIGDKQGTVEALVYMLGLGKGKTRGRKGGGLQKTQTWRTIIITTGEEPLSTDSSAAGVKTRALEWYGQPFGGDEQAARETYAILSQHHGHAGPLFIRHLLDSLKDDPDMLKNDYKAAVAHLEAACPKAQGSHTTAVAIIMLADFYVNHWLLGMSEEDAYQSSTALGQMALSQLETAEDADQAQRALEWVRSWIAQHKPKFEPGASERYGWQGTMFNADVGYTYMYPSAFKRCMTDGGFSERRTLRDFAERGWIETTYRDADKKLRYKVRKKEPSSGDWVEVIVLLPMKSDQKTG